MTWSNGPNAGIHDDLDQLPDEFLKQPDDPVGQAGAIWEEIEAKQKEAKQAERHRLHAMGIWVTKEWVRIPVKDLKDGHLRNIIRLLAKAAEREASETLAWYVSCPLPRGDGAMMAFEQELSYWMGEYDYEEPAEGILRRMAIWPHLEAEIKRRGWNDNLDEPSPW